MSAAVSRASEICALPVESRADCLGAGIRAREWALSLGWDWRDADELAILVVELTNNAVRHGGPGICRIDLDPSWASVIVEDSGRGFPPAFLSNGAASASDPALVAPPQEASGSASLKSIDLWVGEAEPPVDPIPRSGGLGAGLSCARRLADTLTLENRPEGGARARASRRPRRRPRGPA